MNFGSETLSSHAQEALSNELCSLASLSDPFFPGRVVAVSLAEYVRHCHGASVSIPASDPHPKASLASHASSLALIAHPGLRVVLWMEGGPLRQGPVPGGMGL